jgi:hypothetical protein
LGFLVLGILSFDFLYENIVGHSCCQPIDEPCRCVIGVSHRIHWHTF